MNICITGGAGFIGSHISDLLIENGHRVTILDNLSSGTTEFIHPAAEFIEIDIRQKKDIRKIFETHRFDAVYHEAAQTMVPVSVDNPYFDADENILGLLSVLEASRKTGVKKVIFASSAAVYGDNPALPLSETETPAPTSFYGLTKMMTESYLSLYKNLYGLDYTVLRYSNVYGPRQGANGEGGVIYIFAKLLAEGAPLTIFGDGGQTRDFISVHDVAAANLAALTKGSGAVCNVSTETQITLNDLAAEMVKQSGKQVEIRHTAPRPGDIYHSILANGNAKNLLSWEPKTDLSEGLKDTIEFFEKHLRK